MPVQQPDKKPAEQDAARCRRLADAVSTHVLSALGRPADLQRVQVRPLWQDRYRVNVFVGVDAVSSRVAHSFFLVIDDNGALLGSVPEITKQY